MEQVAGRCDIRFGIACAVVIAWAVAVASVWAVRTPFFLQPDERAHFDGVAALFDAGRPFKLSAATSGVGVTTQERYLDRSIGYRRLRYDPTARVGPDYGTAPFVARFDAAAPAPSGVPPHSGAALPYVSFLYPVAYYALVATVMRAAHVLGHGSLWTDLLAARFVGVVLLGVTLAAAAGVFRAVAFTRVQTVLGLACVGWLPLASWVAGYVQPDDSSFALFTVVLWLGLRSRGRLPLRDAIVLALVLALFFFVKQHFALCAWLATVAFAVTRMRGRIRAEAVGIPALLIAVPLAGFALSFRATVAPALGYANAAFAQAGSGFGAAHVLAVVRGLIDGVRNAYLDGDAFGDYWLHFGARGESIFPPPGGVAIGYGIAGAMALAGASFLAAQIAVMRRIAAIGTRRSRWTALRLTFASLPLNAYATTSALLLVAYAQSDEKVFLEGRYWLPVSVAMVVLLARCMRKNGTTQRSRARTIVLASFAAYAAVASIAGLAAIQREFYSPSPVPLRYALAAVMTVKDGQRAISADAVVRPRDRIDIAGFAVDPRTGENAERVFAVIDGARRVDAAIGAAVPEAAGLYSDMTILHSGFDLRVIVDDATAGPHDIAIFVESRGLPPLPIRDHVSFRIAS